ncbi:hypothetical protein A2U01_0096944, partial [Trifolium medium]|nr:hypothetical protein [Trifolium medium]
AGVCARRRGLLCVAQLKKGKLAVFAVDCAWHREYCAWRIGILLSCAWRSRSGLYKEN